MFVKATVCEMVSACSLLRTLFSVCHLSFDFIYGMFLFPEHSNFYLIKCIAHVPFGFTFVFCIEKNFLSQPHIQILIIIIKEEEGGERPVYPFSTSTILLFS